MPTTTTTLGRLELVNPDLGYDGGAGLQSVEEALRTKISDAVSSRYYASAAIADSTTTEYRHNFGIALDEFSVLIYTGTHPDLTRVADPVGAGWVIAAKTGEEKQTIEVTTPASGGPHTFAVFAIQGGSGGGGLELALISGADTAVPNTHYLVDGTAAPYTITLPQGQDGAVLRFSDATSDWGTSNVTLQGDGAETIRLDAANNDNTLVLDVANSWVQLMWDGTQWQVDSPLTPSAGNFTGDVSIGGALAVDSITDLAATGAVDFPNGWSIATGDVISIFDTGFWTPAYTATGSSNISGTPTANQSFYMRVNNLVFFSMSVTIQTTANDASSIALFTFPIAATVASASEVQGNMTGLNTGVTTIFNGVAVATGSFNRIALRFRGDTTNTNTNYQVTGIYRIP